MSLTEVKEGQAQSLVKPKIVAPPVIDDKKVVVSSKPKASTTQTMGPVAPKPGETKEQYTERITPPKENYVPPSPGIKADFENNELVTRVTLRPGESSKLGWTAGTPTTTTTTVTNINQLTGLPNGPEKAAAIKAYSQGGTVTLTSTSQGYELKGYTTSQNKTEGIEPTRKMTSGEIISNRFTKPGYDVFYGNQKGPEQLFATAGDVRVTKGPSTKAIMAEIGSTIAVTMPLGAITKISMGAAQTLINPTTGKAIGTLGKVYKYGVKPAFIGTGLAGIGIQAGYTKAQYDAGKITTRQVSVDVLNVGVGFAAFGATGGSPENIWSKFKVRTPGDILTTNKGVIGRITKANQLGTKTGNIETNYNNIRIKRPGELLRSETMNKKQNIINTQGLKIGEQMTHFVQRDFIPSQKKAELFIDFPGSTSSAGKNIELISIGGAKAINKIIPGVEGPIKTDVLTTVKYQSAEKLGVIKTGKKIIYTKLSSPEPTPVSNKTPLRFEKIGDVKGFTDKSFTKSEMYDLKLPDRPKGPSTKIKTDFFDSTKAKIKNIIEPNYWIPKKQTIIPHGPEVKLTGKIEIPFPSVEDVQGLNKLYSSGFKPAKAIDTTPKFSHDMRQGAIDYLKGLSKYKSENKPKLNLKSNTYTGGEKVIGTTSGGLALESQRPLSSFEKALIRSEIEQTPVFNVYPKPSRMTARLGPIITPITSIKAAVQTTADYAGVMNKRFTSMGFKTETKTDRIQTSNRDTSTMKTARSRLFGAGVLDITTPRQTTRTEQRQATIQTTKTNTVFENMLMTKFDYQRENVLRQPPYVPGFPLMGLTGGGEGGRGSDDWERYFRKRKFNIGSINQAFGIGMKPMKIRGLRL